MIQLSQPAIVKIKGMVEGENNPRLFLRIGVNEGGCSGFSYAMGLDDEQQESDHSLDFSGLKVVVTEADLKYLDGLQIDYKDSGMGGGFTLDNPNATATCGCGNSFRTREDSGVAQACD
ncbi:MAG: iron-sulfur cluster assembly accessory protein [Gorillibacterium sp.]|nr:iron-sulfur cluster assembly accessory protein [Gorillibacterium sp.]